MRMMASISSFTNPFCSVANPNELYCLSSDVANDLLKAQDIGKNTIEHLIKARIVEKTIEFHEPIKRSKLQQYSQPVKSQRN